MRTTEAPDDVQAICGAWHDGLNTQMCRVHLRRPFTACRLVTELRKILKGTTSLVDRDRPKLEAALEFAKREMALDIAEHDIRRAVADAAKVGLDVRDAREFFRQAVEAEYRA